MTSTVNRLIFIGAILIIAGGIFLTSWMAQNEDTRLREDLLSKSRLVKEGFGSEQVTALTGMPSDVSSTNYNAMKAEMLRVRMADPPIRFLYFMGERPDGTIIFLVDSEPADSEDYSPPGQEYPEASEILKNAFATGRETTEGPTADRWGTWVSSITPFTDPATGRVIAIFGMDVDARNWNLKIAVACLPPIIATLILLLLLLVFYYVQQRNEREREILEKSHQILRESEHRLNDIVNFLPDATFVINQEGRVITWNKAIEDMAGVKAADMLGKGDHEYALPFYNEKRPILIDLVLHPDDKAAEDYSGGIYRVGNSLVAETDTRLVRPDGLHAVLAARASPLRDVKGDLVGAIETIRDVTERKILEREMACHAEELKQFSQKVQQVNDKLNLMNRITRHDILNQLTAIIGYLELMREGFPDPRLQEYIGIQIRAANNIRDQILFTKAYQDIGSQEPRWFDVRSLIGSAVEKLHLSGIRVAVDIDRTEIHADPLLEKVFYTLLENAIRHGENVTTIRFSCGEQEDGLVIRYEDDGVGVPAAHKEDIFDKKYFKHTGYGLFLSRTILSITGITIRENGIPGTGARFEILVPRGTYRFRQPD